MRTGNAIASAAAALALLASNVPAQVAREEVDLAVIQKIRDEGLNRSQLPQLAHHLLDVIGPRLTGSPTMKQANEWTASILREWGATNVVVEPRGEFGRGWERISSSARMVAPFVHPLNAQPMAWTGSTSGTVAGPVLIVQADSAPDVARFHGKLKGAWVVLSPAPRPQPEWRAPARRFDADSLLAPARPDTSMFGRMTFDELWAFYLPQLQRFSDLTLALKAEGILGILSPSRRAYGILEVDGDYLGMDPKRPIAPPILTISQEDFGTIRRDLDGGTPVRVEANVQNRFTEVTQGYNTLGEIRGNDRADEVVMIGAHLDSWHAGTGATDNGAGSLVMLEAMRILRALDLHPRRTVRIALWDGEEQGLLGSRGWVARHAAELPKISAYLNVDNGAGRLRGIWDQSNEQAIPIFEQILWPFRDLGVVAVRHGNTSGTDHLSFDAAGVPAFNFIQDPIDYETRTHHSNLDTYERLPMDDLKQAAVVVAATVWQLANREAMMPRKPAL